MNTTARAFTSTEAASGITLGQIGINDCCGMKRAFQYFFSLHISVNGFYDVGGKEREDFLPLYWSSLSLVSYGRAFTCSMEEKMSECVWNMHGFLSSKWKGGRDDAVQTSRLQNHLAFTGKNISGKSCQRSICRIFFFMILCQQKHMLKVFFGITTQRTTLGGRY